MKHKYRNHHEIYTDGSKCEGKVASAASINNQTLVKRLPDNSSVFSAEMTAILLALSYVSKTNNRHFLILSDSLSSLQALNSFDTTNPLLQEVLFNLIHLEKSGKSIVFCWIPSHVGIPGNENADRAAKLALSSPYEHCTVPYTDFKTTIRKHITDAWQNRWNLSDNSKLKLIKPTVNITPPIPQTNRKTDVTLTRLRIGHTYCTHSHLLRGEEPPQCKPCKATLTVKHILLDCKHLQNIRTKHFKSKSIEHLFTKNDPRKIIGFIKETGFLNSI
jgi:ribonuclease HI